MTKNKKKILIVLAVLALSAVVFFSIENAPQSYDDESCDEYYTRENISAQGGEGKRLVVVEGKIYDISDWNTTYESGDFLLLKDLTEEEIASLGEPQGLLCPKVLENLSYRARIGFSSGMRELTLELVNKTVEDLKERQKRLPNSEEKYEGWHLFTNISLVRVEEPCTEDIGIIILKQPLSLGELSLCDKKIFSAGENESMIYIVREDEIDEFSEFFLIALMETEEYAHIQRYGI